MRKLLITAAALCLAAAPAAWAQPDQHEHRGGGPPGGGHPGGQPGGQPGGHPGGPPGGGGRPPGGGFQPGPRPGGAPGGAPGGGGFQPGQRPGAGFQGGGNHGAPGFRGGAGFQARPGGGYTFTGSRGAGPGFHGAGNFSYRGRTFNRFRAAPFVYPAGWGYRRWSIGAFLPALFLSQQYYLYDYGAYSLGPPPPGCQWVRYGPDALLVNVYTGAVVDVAYGVFWW
jgi:Ni/Co efflux regulator RcnB